MHTLTNTLLKVIFRFSPSCSSKFFQSLLWSQSHAHVLGVCYSSTWGFCICQDSSRGADQWEIYTCIYIKGFVTGLHNGGSWLSSSMRLQYPQLILEIESEGKWSGQEDPEKAVTHKHKLSPLSTAWDLCFRGWLPLTLTMQVSLRSRASEWWGVYHKAGQEPEFLKEDPREGGEIALLAFASLLPSDLLNLPGMSLVVPLDHKYTSKGIMGNVVQPVSGYITKLSCLCSSYPNISV